jgi:hypothetical protein
LCLIHLDTLADVYPAVGVDSVDHLSDRTQAGGGKDVLREPEMEKKG